jgi:rhomboid protease GluP
VIRVRDGEDESVLTIEEFERRARRGELSPHALVNMPALTGDEFVEARALPIFLAVYDPRRLLFRRHFQLGRLPLVTGAVALVCVLLWLVARDLGDGAVTREALVALGAKSRARIVDEGETWRLLMASLLHKDGVHVAFNVFVLVAVGAVMESVYRRGDLLLVLVMSGVACMTTSTVLSPPLTVGASGMVFGCLGAAMIFGLRFADVLAVRYRVYFGVVVVIYTAAAFWTGLLRSSTDNWGHAGGLVTGVVMGLVVQPRLLRLSQAREPRLVAAAPWLLSLALVVVVCLGGQLVPRALGGFVPLPFPAFGLVLEHPRTWSRTPNPLGFVAVGNGTDALASLACSKATSPGSLPSLEQVTRRFVDEELFGLSRQGHIAQLEVDAADDVHLAGVPARRLGLSFVAAEGPFFANAWVFVRGRLACELVTAWRSDASAVARGTLDELGARLRIVPTSDEEQGRAQTQRHPDSTRAWLTLAHAHADAGVVTEARAAFARARHFAVDEPSLQPRVGLDVARFELSLGPAGDVDAAATALLTGLRAKPPPASTVPPARSGDGSTKAADLDAIDVVVQLAQAAVAAGRTDLVCALLQEGRRHAPTDLRVVAHPGCPP